MKTMKVGGDEWPLLFTTWTVDQFHQMTGINLYDPVQMYKVFKEDEQYEPDDIKVIVKLAYCTLAAAQMPDNADDNWKPPFSWRGIMNKLSLKDLPAIVEPIIAAYFDRDVKEIVDEAEKNEPALQSAGQ